MIENRYKKLHEAVDFFSQSLHVEQLMGYGYELIHRTLGLGQSALFMLKDNNYSLIMQNHYPIITFEEPVNPNHKTLAVRFGRVLTKDFDKYFSEDLISNFEMKLAIPIINKEHLVGFIISSGVQLGVLDDEVLEFTAAINQLMNKSYEHASAYSDLEIKNLELDKRVFNLFFINHSSRLLLSELKLTQLYVLCIDIVRELTASAITSFFVTDEVTNKMVLRGYKNILSFEQHYDELPYPSKLRNSIKSIFHMGTERDQIEAIIGDVTPLLRVKAEHVIFIVKEKIIGLITISKPVNDYEYDNTILELIVSIANSIYIAMHNAKQFQELEVHRQKLSAKIVAIESLNRSIKNIQSCQSLEEMSDIVMQTLKYGFHVKRCALLIEGETKRDCIAHEGFDTVPHWLESLPLKHLKKRVEFTKELSSSFVKTVIEETNYAIDENNCMIILPVEMDIITETGQMRLGTLYIDRLEHPLHAQDELAFEALVNAIAPYIYWRGIETICHTEHSLKPDVKLLHLLNNCYDSYEKHQIEYWIYISRISGTCENWLEVYKNQTCESNAVLFGNYRLIVTHHEIAGDWTYAIKGTEVQETFNTLMKLVL